MVVFLDTSSGKKGKKKRIFVQILPRNTRLVKGSKRGAVRGTEQKTERGQGTRKNIKFQGDMGKRKRLILIF